MSKKDNKAPAIDEPEPEAESAPQAEPAAPPAEIRTADDWAAAKGLTPAMNGTRENPRFWRWVAARALLGWPAGMELTEASFDAAIESAATVEIKN